MVTKKDVMDALQAYHDDRDDELSRAKMVIDTLNVLVSELRDEREQMIEALNAREIDSKVMLKRTFEVIRTAAGASCPRELTPEHRVVLDTFSNVISTENPHKYLSPEPPRNPYRTWKKKLF